MPEKWLQPFRPQLETRQELIKVFLCEKKVAEELVGFSMYQGVLAVGRIPHHFTLEEGLACCDEQIVLPMPPKVDSLNVASASAVFLYEAWRQRRTNASR